MQIPRPTPSCSRFSTIELPCAKCGLQMRLVLIEPKTGRLEQRTYACTGCEFGESFLLTM
jgi:hypothetical protein